jgi:hypothetical protein
MHLDDPSALLTTCAPSGLPLRGRFAELEAVTHHLINGRSVLLVGPDDIGKSAIASAITVPGVTRRDPLASVTRKDAHHLRLSLDRGAVVLATSRTSSAKAIGAVRRILWRFRILTVRPLPAVAIRLVLRDVLTDDESLLRQVPARWWTEAIDAADGKPGYAVAIARTALKEWATRGRIASPGLAIIDHRIARAIVE